MKFEYIFETAGPCDFTDHLFVMDLSLPLTYSFITSCTFIAYLCKSNKNDTKCYDKNRFVIFHEN